MKWLGASNFNNNGLLSFIALHPRTKQDFHSTKEHTDIRLSEPIASRWRKERITKIFPKQIYQSKISFYLVFYKI